MKHQESRKENGNPKGYSELGALLSQSYLYSGMPLHKELGYAQQTNISTKGFSAVSELLRVSLAFFEELRERVIFPFRDDSLVVLIFLAQSKQMD